MFTNHTAYNNIVAILQKRSTETSKKIVFVKDSQNEVHVTYSELLKNAAQILAFLQQQNIKAGNELLIQVEDEQAYLSVFTACLLGNIIAVPLATGSQDEHIRKIRNVWGKMSNPYLVADKKIFKRLEAFYTRENAAWWNDAGERLFVLPDVLPETATAINTGAQPGDIAYLQFSSGSTGDPKGVEITHSNVLHNTDGMLNSSRSHADETIVSWLPLTHDMGLVGCFFCGILGNLNTVILPTSLFIKKPLIWMEKVDAHRGNISFSPNFGYKYFLQEWQTKQRNITWNLDCLRIIYNGAEQISHRIIQDFITSLEQYGLNQNCMLPGYGLAEATLTVSIHNPGTPVETINISRDKTNIGDAIEISGDETKSITFVSCGKAIENMQVRICDDQHNTLAENWVGHVQIGGACITGGYYGQKEYPLFSPDRWLITGDIGFVHEGNLYITGRQKEMIIINGMNFYPYDIEKMLEVADPKLFALTKVAATSVMPEGNTEEKLVVFVLWRGGSELFVPIAEVARKTILKHLGLVVYDVVPVKRIPKTTSGKLQRKKLAAEYIVSLKENLTAQPEQQSVPLQEQSFMQLIRQEITRLYGLPHIDTRQSFTELGFDSLRSTELINSLNNKLHTQLNPTIVFEYPTIELLARYLVKTGAQNHDEPVKEQHRQNLFEPVAIIGMSGIFPGGADDPEKLWELLTKGTDTVKEIPESRWAHEVFYDSSYETPGKTNTKNASLIHNVDLFDAGFFGISPREAESLDPQQRLLLEVSFNALQDAGYNLPGLQNSNTGVFVGLSHSDYTQAHIHSGQPDSIDAYSLTGTINSTAAGRLSYFFNLAGPALIIDTACSSSLVSVHYASKSLQTGDCDMAIAGGVNTILAPEPFISLTKIQALSPDGRCKTFDESANGYGRGEGCGMVVLKRLADAERDNDNILGIIRASAINQDGKSNGLTAPNGLAQQRLLQKAIAISGISPEKISYVEAHGTGTPLGDPLELQAMHTAYGSNNRTLLTGSIKSNIGHLESAAGIAGLTKILLSFKYGMLPGNLHFRNPNPLIPWRELNLKIVDKNLPWQTTDKRIAGISSFGFSGTNAHLILEESPQTEHVLQPKDAYVCTLSAHNIPALKQMAAELAEYIQAHQPEMGALCYNVNRRNNQLRYSKYIVAANADDMVKALLAVAYTGEGIAEKQENSHGLIAFQFTGQGSQYTGMGKELYTDFEVYRNAIDECSSIYEKYNPGVSLKEILFSDAEGIINQTRYSQPTLFCTGYALTKLFASFGIQPGIVSGHSLGEITAACIAGMLSTEDAIRLISDRARFMQEQPTGGGMLSVMASEKDVKNILSQHGISLAIAGVNSDTQTVVSGLLTEIERLKPYLQQKDIMGIPLTVSHAFHSPLMNAAAEKLKETVATISLNKPVIPVISNITGSVYTNEQLQDNNYWSQHLLSAVRYADITHTLKRAGATICIELGPQPVLTNIGKQNATGIEYWIPTLKKGNSATKQFLASLAILQEAGIAIDWKKAEGNHVPKHLTLPVYPFQKKRYWKELSIGKHGTPQNTAQEIPTGIPLYQYGYDTIPQPVSASPQSRRFVIIYDKQTAPVTQFINQNRNHHYEAYPVNNIPKTIREDDIVCYIANAMGTDVIEHIDAVNVLKLLQAIQKQPVSKFIILTNDVHVNTGQYNLNNSLLWGFAVAAKTELPNLDIAVIDTGADNISNTLSVISQYYTQLPAQLIIDKTQWKIPKLVTIPTPPTGTTAFKKDGIYIVTGGLGSIGVQLINWMIGKGAGNIIIIGRRYPNDEQEKLMNNWREQNCNIQFIKADISNKTVLKQQLNFLNPFAIKGVFHVAATLNDKLISSHNEESFQSVFPAKVNGAWNLHQLSLDWELDYFVLFSSTVSIFGNTGQTNYGSANYFLNRLAAQRVQSGLPALSVCWGPWQDTKMTAGLQSSFEQLGVSLFTSDTAFGMLDRMLGSNVTGTVVAIDMQPETFVNNCPEWLLPTLPAEWQLPAEKPALSTTSVSSFTSKEEIISLLERFSKEILKLNAEDILNTQRPYFEIGFDSLMLNMLKGRIQKETGINIPISHFFQYPTFASLGQYMFETVSPVREEQPAYSFPAIENISNEILAEVEQLSDEEIAKILNDY